MTCGMPMSPERVVIDGVALDTDPSAAGSGVTFCFTERTGGVSSSPYTSLNLGGRCGDDPACVQENRRRVLAAMDAEELMDSLVIPDQVHGDTVAVLTDPFAPLPACISEGADAVVCTVTECAVMLLYADCAPVVLVVPGGFAVVHSGWRGTLAGIAGKAAHSLASAAGVDEAAISAYIGPHITGPAYEVSADLLAQFEDRFGPVARTSERHLNIAGCITASLVEAGLVPERICDCGLCTATLTDRFFSYRAEGGHTGRHGAVAFMRSPEPA